MALKTSSKSQLEEKEIKYVHNIWTETPAKMIKRLEKEKTLKCITHYKFHEWAIASYECGLYDTEWF